MNIIKTIKEKSVATTEAIKNNVGKLMTYSTCAWINFTTMVNAEEKKADASSVTAPLQGLQTIFLSVIGAIGVIILAKNVMEFAQAYQQQDSSSMNNALKGIVAGIIMAGISTVLSILGF